MARTVDDLSPEALALLGEYHLASLATLRADGTPSPANPGVANPASGWHPLVHTIGHRNIQGLAFRPSDGAVFTAEHGPGCDDEINRIVAGGNYGWNPIGLDGGYNELVPMTFAGGVTAAWSSGCPT